MKKLFTTALILTATLTSVYSQQNKCAANIVLKQQMANNPEIAVQQQEFESGFADWKANKPIGFREGEKYVIPVVFHIILRQSKYTCPFPCHCRRTGY